MIGFFTIDGRPCSGSLPQVLHMFHVGHVAATVHECGCVTLMEHAMEVL